MNHIFLSQKAFDCLKTRSAVLKPTKGQATQTEIVQESEKQTIKLCDSHSVKPKRFFNKQIFWIDIFSSCILFFIFREIILLAFYW